MHLMFKTKFYVNRALLAAFGPADLDDHRDPRVRLEREWEIRFGAPRRKQRVAVSARATLGTQPAAALAISADRIGVQATASPQPRQADDAASVAGPTRHSDVAKAA